MTKSDPITHTEKSPVRPRLSFFISSFSVFYYSHSILFYFYFTTFYHLFYIYLLFFVSLNQSKPYSLFSSYQFIYILRRLLLLTFWYSFFIKQARLYSNFYISFLLQFYQSLYIIYCPIFMFITKFAHIFFYFFCFAVHLFSFSSVFVH